jgi:hypothetical protein
LFQRLHQNDAGLLEQHKKNPEINSQQSLEQLLIQSLLDKACWYVAGSGSP